MWVKQRRIVGLVGLALMGWLASHCSSAQCADAVGLAKPAEARKARSTGDQQKQIEDVARRIFAITDVVLDHHIEPATRQEMILTGLRSACAAKKISLPELGRRVSDLKTVDDLAGLLKELWPQLTHGGKPSPTEVEQAIPIVAENRQSSARQQSPAQHRIKQNVESRMRAAPSARTDNRR